VTTAYDIRYSSEFNGYVAAPQGMPYGRYLANSVGSLTELGRELFGVGDGEDWPHITYSTGQMDELLEKARMQECGKQAQENRAFARELMADLGEAIPVTASVNSAAVRALGTRATG